MGSVQTTLKNYFFKEKIGKTSKSEGQVWGILNQLLTSLEEKKQKIKKKKELDYAFSGCFYYQYMLILLQILNIVLVNFSIFLPDFLA